MRARRKRRIWIRAVMLATSTSWISGSGSVVLAAESPGESSASGAEILGTLPRDVSEELQRERQVVVQELGNESGAYGGRIRALVLFDAAADEVFRLLSLPERQLEWRPELQGFEEGMVSANGRIDRYQLKMLFVKVAYHLHYSWDAQQKRIHWKLDPAQPNDFEALDGSWELFPLGEERTLGRFATRLDVGGAIPKFVQDYASRRAVPSTLERCRHWVESGGQWRP